MNSGRAKRGASTRRLDFLAKLRPLVRASVEAERMLRSVTSLLAVEIGQYCIVDYVDPRGNIRRLEIEHADPSRRARLRVACDDTTHEGSGRVAKLVATGGSEMATRVSDSARLRTLGDIVVLDGERVRSYMAATVRMNGATLAVLTLVITQGTRRYDDGDLRFLTDVADWIGLGLENAIRRDTPARVSAPPKGYATPARGFSTEEASSGTRPSPAATRSGSGEARADSKMLRARRPG